ncbi:MAG: GNAT family N-acetyltransferase [Crocinitomicaceae bacterium]|nr:GNAT family N-acetyltransferase [Crocinitomicaceae bacterium]
MPQIRKGTEEDITQLLELIKELAKFEKAEEEVIMTEEILLKDGFGDNKLFDFIVAEQDGKIVGIALYFYKYSTWKGKSIHLEDLIVKEHLRKNGIGTLLFEEVLQIAKKEKVSRFEWQVLDWNEAAINFYDKYGTQYGNEWLNARLTFEQLQAM